MLFPTEKAQGLVATDILRSIAEQWDARHKEENEKAGIAQKADPLVEARMTVSEEARRSRAKIVSSMFNHENVSVNELKMKVADKLAEKLGLDVDRSRSYFTLGKLIEDIVSKMDAMARSELERAVGLDKLGISLTTFVSALSDPTGDGTERLNAALEKSAGRGGVTDAVNRVFTRLKDAADPKSASEVAVQEEIADPARVDDEKGRQERLASLQAALASERLEQVGEIQKVLSDSATAGGAMHAPASAEKLLSMLAYMADQQSGTQSSETSGVAARPPADQTQFILAIGGEAEVLSAASTDTLDEVVSIYIEDGLYERLRTLVV
ncbi:hypothetical protein [Rhizobium sp. AAP43]|uniref:hypothetical protein n=1 Tax=Rhizobium sp. AAP43 TaxID=1523420 RepID=UPI0006B8EEA6|nr:hypothetical protein [Rhizobium sp. AAP43]KPF44458.1 hypothetical protein IP76_11075 [Rhizobium sp. AAP43]